MGMIGGIAEGIRTVGQITVKPLLVVTLVGEAFLYTPAHVIATTGLTDFLAGYRMWVGSALLASCAYLLAHGLAWVFSVIGSLLGDARMRKVRRKWLTTLTPNEKAALIPYIHNQATSATYSLNDDAVRGLEGERMLYRVSSVPCRLGFPFNIQPWTREILSVKSEFLL